MNPRVEAVIRKELREYRRNKFVVGTMVVLPVLFLVIPIGQVLAVKPTMPPAAVRGVIGGATLMLYLVPLILPATLSAYSVIGEREQGTLEPMLTTPLKPEDLLLGKALAALLPTVTIAYALYVAFLLFTRAAASPRVVDVVWQPAPVLIELLAAPLLAAFAIWTGIAISARSNDVRVAQQLSGLAMLPMLGLVSLIAFRVVEPTVALAVGIAVALAVVDVVGWRVVSAMFDRERLLTRYGRT